MKTKFILLLLLSWTSTKILAQEPTYWQMSQKNGMPTNQIYDVLQDSKGNIWFGSDLGIFRYDGYETKRFAPEAYSVEMSNLSEDPEGRMWANNFTGQIFYVEEDSLVLFKDFNELTSSYVNYSHFFFPTILVSSRAGLLVTDFYNREKAVKHPVIACNVASPQKKPESDTRIAGVWGEKIFFQVGGNCFNTIDSNLNVEMLVEELSFPSGKQMTNITSPFQFSGKDFIQHNPSLIRALTPNNEERKFIEIPNQDFVYQSAVFPDNEAGILLLGTKNGITPLNRQLKLIGNSNKWLKGKAVSSIIRDTEGSYWCSTLNDGLFIIPNTKILHWASQNSSLINNQVRTLTKNRDGELIIGFFNGSVMSLNDKQNLITLGNFTGRRLEKLYFDSLSNRLFLNTAETDFYDFNTRKWQKDSKSYPSFKHITSIGEDWIISLSTTACLLTATPLASKQKFENPFIFSPSHSAIDFFQGKKRFREVFRHKKSMMSHFDKMKKRLWIGYTDNLYFYENGEEHILRKPNGKNIYATSVTHTANGILWMGTSQGELLGFRDTTLIFDSGKQDWFSPQNVYGITSQGNLLAVATTDGVYTIDVKNNTHQLINEADGLPTTSVNAIEITHNTIYLATFDGLFSFPLDYRHKNKVAPPISITSFGIWEKDTTLQEEYTLKYNQNNIKIGFVGISHRSRRKFTYQYRMLGIDSSWLNLPSQQNLVRYPSLPPGNFTFEVKIINEDGTESIEPVKIQLHILKPFWLKWWFFLLCGLGIASLMGFIFLLRIRRIKKENKLKAKAQEVESELVRSNLVGLRAQMNPHFIFNALNSIQSYIYFNKRLLAVDYLGKFASLMRLYLHQSKQEYITLKEELDALELYLDLEKTRFEEGFEYAIDFDSSLNIREIMIPSMLLQPYVENAIKHGLLHKEDDNKMLQVLFRIENSTLKCIIEDNGIGREASAEINKVKHKNHQSFASNANDKRLELLNHGKTHQIELEITDLRDATNLCIGTRVEILIPAETELQTQTN